MSDEIVVDVQAVKLAGEKHRAGARNRLPCPLNGLLILVVTFVDVAILENGCVLP